MKALSGWVYSRASISSRNCSAVLNERAQEAKHKDRMAMNMTVLSLIRQKVTYRIYKSAATYR